MTTIYNYNFKKDIRQINKRMQDLTTIEPFLSGNKKKIVKLKILDLKKELIKFQQK